MASLKSTMRCIGAETEGSVLRNFFGFFRARVPTDVLGTTPSTVSLKTQMARVQQRHVHFNVIRVGFDTFSDSTFDRRMERIDYAILRTQNIYAAVNLGVGRVTHWRIDSADADGLDDIGSEDEAEELIERATVGGGGIDCFVVRNISAGFIGIAPQKADGVIAGESGLGDETFAKTFAHEVGHFLSLSHNHGSACPTGTTARNNLMAQSRCAAASGEAGQRVAVLLTAGQGQAMRGHGSTHAPC